MGKFKLKWNSEKILGISAMSISFITLIIFIYQTNLMSKQNYLSILPYLQVSTSDNKAENTYAVNLLNHGVGPAIIEKVSMRYKGNIYHLKDYNDDFFSFLKALQPALDSVEVISSATLNRGIAIPSNATYRLIEVKNSGKDYELLTGSLFELEQAGLEYEIVYKSIQNEHWKITAASDGPIKLD
jgi:hypothetical protein